MTWIVYDSFQDTAGTLITSHVAQYGGGWNVGPANSATANVISPNGHLRCASGQAAGLNYSAYSSGVPVTPDQTAQSDLYIASMDQPNGETMGPSLRMDSATDTFYNGRYKTNNSPRNWSIIKQVNGSQTELGNTPETLIAGSTYRVVFQAIGTSISLSSNGVTKVGPFTDSAIIAANRGGHRMGWSSTTADNTHGLHLLFLNISDSAGNPGRVGRAGGG
jgi:hypothetical protein